MAHHGVSAGQGGRRGKPEELMLPPPLYVLQHLTCCTSGAIGILTIGQKMRNTEHSSLGALITSFVK